ncbi:MAG: hypothetical protein NTZ33_11555 [Bacteroidetes bacterium]|nr:hypothetical protein [Bacteroidota bacterium]
MFKKIFSKRIIKILILLGDFTLLIGILLLLLPYISGCKKDRSFTERPPFTEDQLGWINNKVNPKYRCIAKTTNTQGDSIIVIDTVVSNTKIINKQYFSTNDDDNISYYEGYFYFGIGYINAGYGLSIEINNEYDFYVKLKGNFYDNFSYTIDTANINGVLYTNVYKFENLIIPYQKSNVKIYFKKNIGFLYVEQVNGNNQTMLQ